MFQTKLISSPQNPKFQEPVTLDFLDAELENEIKVEVEYTFTRNCELTHPHALTRSHTRAHTHKCTQSIGTLTHTHSRTVTHARALPHIHTVHTVTHTHKHTHAGVKHLVSPHKAIPAWQ